MARANIALITHQAPITQAIELPQLMLIMSNSLEIQNPCGLLGSDITDE